jgi:hypothetical protein
MLRWYWLDLTLILTTCLNYRLTRLDGCSTMIIISVLKPRVQEIRTVTIVAMYAHQVRDMLLKQGNKEAALLTLFC